MTRGVKPSTIIPAPSPVAKVPTPPSYLSKDAKAEWRRVAPILVEQRRTLDIGDLATLENYCVSVAMVREAHRLLNREGLVTAEGKKHPAVTTLTAAQQQQLRCAGELGLTPAARSRAAMLETADDDADNPLAV